MNHLEKATHTVYCTEKTGSVPRLTQAVMGDPNCNLLRTGVKLHQTLEGLANTPLLRRAMGTLSDGIGIDIGTGVYQEDAQGNPCYDFTFLDQILDVMTGPKTIPFFGISFMPTALSSGTTDQLTEPWMRIDRFPPKDYTRWYEFIHAVVRHVVERYGEENVARWYWDFWNEPDLEFYWRGTQEEFMQTYDYAAAAVKAALPQAKIGGCGTTDRRLPIFKAFLEHCTVGTNYCTGAQGAPLDFITFHVKGGPTGRLGRFSDPWTTTDYEHRAPSLQHMIEAARWSMQTIAAVPGTAGIPVFITECDIDWGIGTSIYQNPNMHYRNSAYFAAFQGALFLAMLDLRDEFPDNPIEATFLDTFYIPGRRIFEGQRTLITGEVIEKPILNALRLLGKLGQERLAVTVHTPSPVSVLATMGADGSIQVMAVNFAESFDADQSHEVHIQLQGLLPDHWHCQHYRIDPTHSNAYTAWLEMGRPVVPTDAQMAMLEATMGLTLAEPAYHIHASELILTALLPPHAVSLWVVTAEPMS